MIFTRDTVTKIKRRYADPYIVVSGNLNQWGIDGALENFLGLKEALHGEKIK